MIGLLLAVEFHHSVCVAETYHTQGTWSASMSFSLKPAFSSALPFLIFSFIYSFNLFISETGFHSGALAGGTLCVN